MDKTELKRLFKASDKIATDNLERLKLWDPAPLNEFASETLYTFIGEVFSNLSPETMDSRAINYLNSNLIIFSGLYGVLKATDAIMPYRLDIGDKVKIDDGTLAIFWKDKINDYLAHECNTPDELIINLASKEYTKGVDFSALKCRVITPEFRTLKDGKLKNVAMWSKKMRGLLTRELSIINAATVEDLNKINLPGYNLEYNSSGYEFIYIKKEH